MLYQISKKFIERSCTVIDSLMISVKARCREISENDVDAIEIYSPMTCASKSRMPDAWLSVGCLLLIYSSKNSARRNLNISQRIKLVCRSAFRNSAALFASMPYDAQKDFAPVGRAVNFPNFLVVNPELPVKSVQDLIALAKSKPGTLGYGSAGNGTPPHMT